MNLGPKRKGVVFEDARNTVRRCFLKTLEAAKIRGFRFHDLRHTFASIFIMRTNDLPTLQNILGHASSRMTQRYVHFRFRVPLAPPPLRSSERLVLTTSIPMTDRSRGIHSAIEGCKLQGRRVRSQLLVARHEREPFRRGG